MTNRGTAATGNEPSADTPTGPATADSPSRQATSGTTDETSSRGSTAGELAGNAPAASPAAQPTAHNGTPANADPTSSPDVAFQSGDDDEFTTTGQVTIPIDAEVQHEGSVSLWVQPGWQPGNKDDATLVQLGDRLRLAKSVDSLRLEAVDAEPADANETSDVGVPISEWSPGEWHRVTATWNRHVLSLYVDGELIGRRMRKRVGDLPRDGQILVGSDLGESRPVAPGLIGRVDLRTRALGDDEVTRDFRDTLSDNEHGGRGQAPRDRGNEPDGRGKDDAAGVDSRGRDNRGRFHQGGRNSR